jgi:hypothetical protein
MKGKLIIKNVRPLMSEDENIKNKLELIENLLKDLKVKRYTDKTIWQKVNDFLKKVSNRERR